MVWTYQTGSIPDWDRRQDEVQPITSEEVRAQLKKMRPRKAADEGVVVAELLRCGSDLLIQLLAQVFTAVLDPRNAVPEY